jgi:phosphatidate phosphatase PAH1
VSDIDGTLTTSDSQIFQQIFAGTDPAQWPDADKVMKVVRRKGYRMVYLTGRPQLLVGRTREWLNGHGFPAGVVKVTDGTMDVIPTEAFVGQFKTAYLQDLVQRVHVSLFAGYGNATTDIHAYQAAGLPNARIFIIGPNGGVDGSTPVPSYTMHLAAAQRFPDLADP